MLVKDICKTEVVTIDKSASVQDARRTMCGKHIGTLVVLDQGTPVAMLTDRDITLKTPSDADFASLSVGDIMSSKLVSIKPEMSVFDSLKQMRAENVRRAPVIGEDGKLVGILTIDDIVCLLADELSELASLLREQFTSEVCAV